MIADYYVPPKEEKVPSYYYVNVSNATKTLDIDYSRKPYLKKILFQGTPTDEDLQNCAREIQKIFADGFQWHDIADMMKLSVQYLNQFFSLSLHEKREYVVRIFDYVIDNTDTPYLPDYFFDPIFKTLADQFVKVIIPDTIDEIIPYEKVSGDFSEESIFEFTKNLKESFEDGLQWKDLGVVIGRVIKFVNQYLETSKDAKKATAKEIVNDIIENTDIPYIPDHFVDSLLKDVSGSFIDNILDAVDSISIF